MRLVDRQDSTVRTIVQPVNEKSRASGYCHSRGFIGVFKKNFYFFFLSAAARIWEGWLFKNARSSSSFNQSVTWPILSGVS